MNHPSIPPNCEFFEQRKDGQYAGDWMFIIGPVWLVNAHREEYRREKIIASVARCAWLDARLGPLPHEWLDPEWVKANNVDGVSFTSYCENNAEAWRKWGRGESWE